MLKDGQGFGRLDKHILRAHRNVKFQPTVITHYVRKVQKEFFDSSYLTSDDRIAQLSEYHEVAKWQTASILRMLGCKLVLHDPVKMEREIREGLDSLQFRGSPPPAPLREPQFTGEWQCAWDEHGDAEERRRQARLRNV